MNGKGVHSFAAVVAITALLLGRRCFVSFDWNVQEKSHVAGFWGDTNAMPSPMHGGGLLAFRKDTLFDIGG